MQRGIALPTILILGVISMVFIATIYYFLGREIRITGTTPVFMSVRDATYSAADLAIGRIEKRGDPLNPFITDPSNPAQTNDPCDPQGPSSYTEQIKFRLRGRQDIFTSNISIECFLRARGGNYLYFISVETCKWNSITNNCADNSEYYKVEVLYPY